MYIITTGIAAPKPDLGAKAKKNKLDSKKKQAWRHQATLTQPLQCDLQSWVAKHNRTTRNGVGNCSSKTGSRRQSRKKTILKHFLIGFLKGKLLAPKLQTSADKSLSQPGYSHSNTIYDLQLQKTKVLRMQPRHQATLTQPLQCVSQHHVANLHVSTHMATPDDNNHAAIPTRSATTDSKTPYYYAHTSTPKAAWNHRCNAVKNRQTDRSLNRRIQEVPFIAACSHFTRKNTRFRAPASSPTQAPMQHSCSHYNAFCTSLHQGQSFCDVLLCDVKPHTALHQCQFFCDALLCRAKSHTALHQGQFFCDVLLFNLKSHTTLHQGLFFCDVWLCRVKCHTTLHQDLFFGDVLLCSVKSHTTLHQVKVIRNSEVLLPNFLWLVICWCWYNWIWWDDLESNILPLFSTGLTGLLSLVGILSLWIQAPNERLLLNLLFGLSDPKVSPDSDVLAAFANRTS